MYYPVGWPRLLQLPQERSEPPLRVAANRDRILVAILTTDSILIWYAKPCVPIISHRRSPQSVAELGDNLLVCWRPDSSMIAVATTGGQALEAVEVLQKAGVKVSGVISVINREEGARENIEAAGLKFEALFSVADLGVVDP